MQVPDWRKLVLNDGVLPEPVPDDNRIVLWVAGRREEDGQHWVRIATVARAQVVVAEGVCAVAATALPARQRFPGFLGKLWGRLRGAPAEHTWVLPNGETAEQAGPRQTDLLLAWSADEAAPLDEARIQARWPDSQPPRPLGPNLFLVAGVGPGTAGAAAEAPVQEAPREPAEQALAAARQAGDRRAELAALTDLGIICLREGDAPRSAALLEEALPLARQLGDPSRESDVVNNLGLAVLAAGQPGRALELFNLALASARAAGDGFAEKAALVHLGLAFSAMGDFPRALAYLEHALTLARSLGDRQHEADLLWYVAIQYAEMGRRDQAVAQAQAAVDLLGKRGHPQAGWLAEQLQKYRHGEPGARLDAGAAGPAGAPDAFFGGIVAGGWSAGSEPAPAAGGPGLLRQAIAAVKATARFIGSGGKRVDAATHQKRLETCAACPHYTGLRCRLCGCFTNVKAWLPHEDCPIGKWPG
jgi:tetratricopeptide (TPR) repeat protein